MRRKLGEVFDQGKCAVYLSSYLQKKIRILIVYLFIHLNMLQKKVIY